MPTAPLKICGYQVVRTPPENYDAEGRGVCSKRPPEINGVFYGGGDRMQWFDVDQDYFAGTLSPDLTDLIKNVREENNGFTCNDSTKDLATARVLLAYSNRLQLRNEIIVLYSPKLEEINGAFVPDHAVQWSGFDVVDLGGNSLLLEAVFSVPEHFGDFAAHLNAHGLLDDEAVARDLIERYEAAAEAELVEELSWLEEEIGPSYGIDLIWIGRLKN